MINLDGILHNDLCRTHRGSLAARRKPSGPSKSLAITGALVGKARRDTILTEEGHYRVHQDIQDGSKMRFVSRVMYDGTNYNGFQLQQNGQPTIQVSGYRIQMCCEITLESLFERPCAF